MTIRPATPADAAAIAHVHVATWHTAYRGIMPDAILDDLSVEDRTQTWTRNLAAPNGPILVAEDDTGAIVGFVCGGPARDEPDFDAEIYALYVLAKVEGQGVGHRLMTALAAQLKADGHESAMLWVLADNARASGFYARLGGEVVREKMYPLGGVELRKLAYGWGDLERLGQAG